MIYISYYIKVKKFVTLIASPVKQLSRRSGTSTLMTMFNYVDIETIVEVVALVESYTFPGASPARSSMTRNHISLAFFDLKAACGYPTTDKPKSIPALTTQ